MPYDYDYDGACESNARVAKVVACATPRSVLQSVSQVRNAKSNGNERRLANDQRLKAQNRRRMTGGDSDAIRVNAIAIAIRHLGRVEETAGTEGTAGGGQRRG